MLKTVVFSPATTISIVAESVAAMARPLSTTRNTVLPLAIVAPGLWQRSGHRPHGV